jgi:hypothetical protein
MRGRLATACLLGAGLLLALPAAAPAQEPTYTAGQDVAPAFEGWVKHADGSQALVFGYMNRNWEEEPDVPIGANNTFSPGPADRGQPTHFLPRRNRFVFEVPVPADFGEQQLVWTLTVHGKTLKAYGSLNRDYFMDNVVLMSETGALGPGSSDPKIRANKPPDVDLETGTELQARVGVPLTLSVKVTDDGVPPRQANSLPLTKDGTLDLQRALARKTGSITVNKINGLHFSWFPYRGPRAMTFDPPQVKTWEDTRSYADSPWSLFDWVPPELPADGRWVARVTFTKPGTYVLRGRADDGGLYSDVQVTVHVAGTDSQ